MVASSWQRSCAPTLLRFIFRAVTRGRLMPQASVIAKTSETEPKTEFDATNNQGQMRLACSALGTGLRRITQQGRLC